jgi:hypothetical protein
VRKQAMGNEEIVLKIGMKNKYNITQSGIELRISAMPPRS